MLAEVTDNGPNQGAWYVESVSMDVRMSAALNPLWLETAPEDLLAICAPDHVASRWTYNHLPACGDGGSGWGDQFVDWAEDHEEMHFASVVQYVGLHPTLDLPRYFESHVRMDSAVLDAVLAAAGEERAECIQEVAATHANFPGAPVDVWWWVESSNQWQPRYAADGPWWNENLVDGECYI